MSIHILLKSDSHFRNYRFQQKPITWKEQRSLNRITHDLIMTQKNVRKFRN